MVDLVQWLGEQLSIDAAKARETADEYGAVWTADDAMESVRSDTGADVLDEPGAPRAYIAEWDPARVLREIDAKRKALDHYTELRRLAKGGVAIYRSAAGAVEVQIQIMALAYAHRPGYQEAWRPEYLD